VKPATPNEKSSDSASPSAKGRETSHEARLVRFLRHGIAVVSGEETGAVVP